MNEWTEYKLSELYNISSGLSKPADQFGFGSPFLSFSDVFWNYFVPEELGQLVNSNDKEQTSCSVKEGDVFLTRTSETIDELGMSSVALKDYPKATFNGFTKRLRPKTKNKVFPRFMGYYLRSPYFRAEVTAYSILTTRASLNNSIIERLSVRLPPLPTQRKIAAILSAYDDLIENNHQRIQLLEEMAEEIYKEWFVRLRFPGYEDCTFYDKNGKEVPHGTPGALPEGWGIQSADKLFDINIGKTPPRKEPKWFSEDNKDVKWVSIKDINSSRVYILDTSEKVTKAGAEKFNMRIAPRGTVILSFKLTVGRVAITTEDMLTNEAIAHFNVTNERLNIAFIYWYLRLFKYGELGNTSSIGSAINSKIVKRMPFLLPDHSSLSKFEELVQPMMNNIQLLVKKNQVLQETRDLLLPRLISGKLDVEQLEMEKSVNT